ncbi:MAG: hypothetical protein EBY21_14930 [Alphaproteobacteria bacterium]|nr:hypothetical protein [Alphaproteobacteria bacterium]
MNAPPRRPCRGGSGIDAIANAVGFLDIAGRAINNSSGNLAFQGGARENAAPTGRIQAGSLLDQDDIIGACQLNCACA